MKIRINLGRFADLPDILFLMFVLFGTLAIILVLVACCIVLWPIALIVGCFWGLRYLWRKITNRDERA